MIRIVKDPENHTLEELVQMYMDEGFDRETAEMYSDILKNPPEGITIN